MTRETEQTYRELLARAKSAAELSYSPYSKYPVGAAVLTDDGTVISGCNVENRSIGLTICAERTTFVKAISEGLLKIRAVAVVCLLSPESWPCGLCRQFMSEFGSDIEVVVQSAEGNIKCMTIAQLLPQNARLAETSQLKNA